MAQPFDVNAGVLTGDARALVEPVASVSNVGFGMFSVSASGTLAYRPGRSGRTHPVWLDRKGVNLGPVAELGNYGELALSRDGSRAALTRLGRTWDIELLELARGLPTRFTFDGANEGNPVWSPDKSRLAFTSIRNGRQNIYVRASNGTGSEAVLLESDADKVLNDWSPDDAYLLYTNMDATTGSDLWTLSLTGERKSTPFLKTPAREGQGQISPKGGLVAYVSDESGTSEVYVRTFPDGAGPWQVSKGGGIEPRWRADGKELFYRVAGRQLQLMSVDVISDPVFQITGRREVLASPFVGAGGMNRNPRWAPAPDGKRFLGVVPEVQDMPGPLTVLLNWQSELEK